MNKFESARDEVVALISAHVSIPPDERSQVVEAVAQAYLETNFAIGEDSEPERNLEKSLTDDTWRAIHNEDAKLLDSVSAIVAGLITLTGNPAPLLFKLISFLYKYRRMQVVLTAQQGLVLKAIGAGKSGGSTIEEILERLPAQLSLDYDGVEEILHDLENVRKLNNETTKLVGEDGGKWFDIDIFNRLGP